MKYIIFDKINSTMPIDEPIIIFPNMVGHDTIAKSIDSKVVGAGFVDLNEQVCYGESTSLNISSRSEDTNIF